MKLVLFDVKERIGYITLNRPEKRNALSYEMVSELQQAFSLAEEDQTVKVVVLRATGEAFCAGADLQSLQQMQTNSWEENFADSNQLKELFLKIYQFKKVVIAEVQGHALAGGCGLTTVCDFVWAVPEAKFGYTEVRIGFVPALVLVFLIRKIGEQKARHLLLSGELYQAREAQQWGLCHEVVNPEALSESVFSFAQKLIKNNSGHSMQTTKKMIDAVQGMNLLEALQYAATQNAEARASDDCKKGIRAFLNKEKLSW
ncbi:MAG: enoyl-CoA hydratase/isomerase family protein [Bacteroidetes bacterium]|nr:enoyl-CoA hydratase/isomerase family protein [Bacteroidota bacterium]